MIPPSPSLSALITRPTYLTVTMIVTAQKIRDDDPVDVLRGRLDRVRVTGIEGRLNRVDRAGADVAEYDSQRGHGQGRPA